MGLSFIFYAFLIFLAYKLVFGFIIPVFKTTRKIKKSFSEMQERMQQQAAPDKHYTATQEKEMDKKNKAGDYIEFEEVK